MQVKNKTMYRKTTVKEEIMQIKRAEWRVSDKWVMLYLQHKDLVCPSGQLLPSQGIGFVSSSCRTAITGRCLGHTGTSLSTKYTHFKNYYFMKGLFSIIDTVTCLRDVQLSCKFNQSFVPLTTRVLQGTFLLLTPHGFVSTEISF